MQEKWPFEEGKIHIRAGHIGETNDNWDNGFYTNGLVENLSIIFLIDSGSTASIIAIDVFEKLPMTICNLLVPNKTQINDVNGNKISSIGSITLGITLGLEA